MDHGWQWNASENFADAEPTGACFFSFVASSVSMREVRVWVFLFIRLLPFDSRRLVDGQRKFDILLFLSAYYGALNVYALWRAGHSSITVNVHVRARAQQNWHMMRLDLNYILHAKPSPKKANKNQKTPNGMESENVVSKLFHGIAVSGLVSHLPLLIYLASTPLDFGPIKVRRSAFFV